MRPGFNVCMTICKRTATNVPERDLRRLTINRGTRQTGGYSPGQMTNHMIIKAKEPRDFEDLEKGEICEQSGLWFPAHALVRRAGKIMGDTYAFNENNEEEDRG